MLPLLLVPLIVVACGGATRSRSREPGSKIEVVAPAHAKLSREPLVAPIAADDLLAYIPSLYSLVAHVSVRKLRTSEFYVQHEDRILGELATHRQTLIATCQFDPVMSVQGVSLGVGASAVLVVSTSLGSTRIEKCIRTMGTESLLEALQ